MPCVYVHRRADDGRIFYVGKGSREDRASYLKKRNPYWQAVAAKHGVVIEIAAHFETDALACECERELIAWYGRDNLTNLTDGGEGSVGVVMTDETRAKLSVLARAPRSQAWVDSMRAARAGGGNGGVVKAGDKLPGWWKDRIAAAKVGELNPQHGKRGLYSTRSRAVANTGYGYVFASVSEAADFLGIKMKTLYNMLSGHRPNPYQLEFV
jgi:hypothetical protein